jgi:Ca-activated chloride channel family protein
MSKLSKPTPITALAALLLGSLLLAAPTAHADRVRLDVQLGTPVLLAGSSQRAFLKVGLTGFPLEAGEERTPVNVSIVLDRSGSMSGEKIRKAREAAIMAVDRLGPDDIVSVVAYNHSVQVLVPATKVRNRGEIYREINRVFSSGNTALFAGVSKGAYEVRKFIERNRVNRVILLSDGLANVGPSSPGELGNLGWSLAKEGISVTTIGLGHGYNEDLMFELARNSDGNHAFAENASDLARIFSYEFGDVLSVVAREVEVTIRCAPGIRPIRVLGRPADIHGREIVAGLNQIYADQEKFLLVEVEVPASSSGSSRELATVDVRYANTISRTTDLLGSKVVVSFADSLATVDRYRNETVMVSSVELIANEANKYAVKLRDQGRVAEAQRALEDNAAFLDDNASRYKSTKLKKRASSNRKSKARMAKPAEWNSQRKEMFDDAFAADMQQAW